MMYLEVVIERVRRRLIVRGGDEAFAALDALERLSPMELDVLARQEAKETAVLARREAS